MQKSIALYGIGRGPNIPVGGKQAQLRVNGLRSGCVVAYKITNGEPAGHQEVFSDGEHIIESCDFVSVAYTGKDLDLICFLVF